MVRVPSYKNVQIDNKLTCKEWIWQEGTGGILALMVEGTLTFNADIDVSELGFKGGRSSVDIPVTCVSPTTPNYSATASNMAGNKGEGAITSSYFNPGTSIANIRGYGPTWNGGGGGNGQWSGGGGGANSNYGGNGDNQACSTPGNMVRGFLNFNLGSPIKYEENSFIPSQRMYMGGGGGAGTGAGTDGGNGGGIVMIVAQKLQFNSNYAIKANGGSVVDTVSRAGAGGGGAGGSIHLSVEDYGDINAEIMGGNGGSVDRGTCANTDNSMGAGGGGSGGFMLVMGDMDKQLINSRQVKLNGGNPGKIKISSGIPCDMSSDKGGDGLVKGNFKVQLKGFLRNHIYTPSDTLVCQNEMVTVTASQPMGGTENYDNYYWELSLNGSDWKDVSETNTNGLTFLKHQFTEDAYVRRIVKSEVTDTSLHIRIKVRSAIDDNQIAPDITLCWTEETHEIRGNKPTEGGGSGPYTFEWQVLNDNGDTWSTINNAANENLSVSLSKNDNIRSMKYRRRAISSQGCVSEWDATVITVQPAIKNLIDTTDYQVCGNIARKVVFQEIKGGNGIDYKYWWEMSEDKQEWFDESRQHDYKPTLDQTDPYGEYYYRRRVESGECKDTSDLIRVRFDRQPQPYEFEIITNNKPDGLVGDKALTFLFTANLDVQQSSDAGSGRWSSPNEELMFEPNQMSTTVNNLQFDINTITWTAKNGVCAAVSKSVDIEVKDVIIPSGFSPNGDGINDCFRIVGGENAISSELIILDRYKKVVFESKSFNKGSSDLTDCTGWWDGCNSSGNELPTDTYFYQLTLKGGNDKVYIHKGYVVLKR